MLLNFISSLVNQYAHSKVTTTKKKGRKRTEKKKKKKKLEKKKRKKMGIQMRVTS